MPHTERALPSRFERQASHARGGLGEVFVAFDRELKRRVALKELQKSVAHDAVCRARFLSEAEITGRLEHPGIVPVYGLGWSADGRPYYAMRFIEGETLRSAIERFHRDSGRGGAGQELAFRRLLRCVIEACNAVGYAHSRGVIHRDLKPENIMLGPFGETLVVDWGMAKGAEGEVALATETVEGRPWDSAATRPGSVLGTPRYMSPEQASGANEQVGPASDVYALGAILYFVLVGRDPFPQGDLASVLDRVRRGIFPAPRRVRRTVDAMLEGICLKAMALEPADRHAGALELGDELERWLADVRYRDEQGRAMEEVRASLSRLCLERAHNVFGQDAHGEGMLWLARALESAPADPPELGRVIRLSVSCWHGRQKNLERVFPHRGTIQAIALCPEGRRLATAGTDGSAWVWDLSTGSALLKGLRHEGALRGVAFRPDGLVLATTGDDGTIRQWDALSGQRFGPLIRNQSSIGSVAYSADGSRLAGASGAGEPSLWDAATGLPLGDQWESVAGVTGLSFSADGSRLALAGEDGVIRILESASGRPVGELLRHEASVACLQFDERSCVLLTGGTDGVVRLWDLERGETLLSLAGQGAIRCVGIRPGGLAFTTAGDNGIARHWAVATGRPISERLDHRAAVLCLAFRPDGTIVATGSEDGSIRLWCAETGLPIGAADVARRSRQGADLHPGWASVAGRGSGPGCTLLEGSGAAGGRCGTSGVLVTC